MTIISAALTRFLGRTPNTPKSHDVRRAPHSRKPTIQRTWRTNPVVGAVAPIGEVAAMRSNLHQSPVTSHQSLWTLSPMTLEFRSGLRIAVIRSQP